MNPAPEPTCLSMYASGQISPPNTRIVRCGLPAGHDGDHDEMIDGEPGNSWPQIPPPYVGDLRAGPSVSGQPTPDPPPVAYAEHERAVLEVIAERDRYHETADSLADAIAVLTGVDIGEHSSTNDPWANALEAVQRSAPVRQRADDGYLTSLEDFRRDVVMALVTEDQDEERTNAEAVARVRELVAADRINREINVPAENVRTRCLTLAVVALRDVTAPDALPGPFEDLAPGIRALGTEVKALRENGRRLSHHAARLRSQLAEAREQRDEALSALRLIADKLDIAQAATPSLVADLTVRYVDGAAANLGAALERAEAAHERLSTLSGIADGERELRAAQLERERDSLREERARLVAEVRKIAAEYDAEAEQAARRSTGEMSQSNDRAGMYLRGAGQVWADAASRLRAVAAAPVEAPASPPQSKSRPRNLNSAGDNASRLEPAEPDVDELVSTPAGRAWLAGVAEREASRPAPVVDTREDIEARLKTAPAAPVQPEEQGDPLIDDAALVEIGRLRRVNGEWGLVMSTLIDGLAERGVPTPLGGRYTQAALDEIDRLRAALATAERERDEWKATALRFRDDVWEAMWPGVPVDQAVNIRGSLQSLLATLRADLATAEREAERLRGELVIQYASGVAIADKLSSVGSCYFGCHKAAHANADALRALLSPTPEPGSSS